MAIDVPGGLDGRRNPSHLGMRGLSLGFVLATPQYHQIAKIGEGTYGVVFRAHDRATNRLLALKQIRCGVWAR